MAKKPDISGSKNGRWKGGRWISSKGYVMVWAPGHPACNCRNYAPEHRKVFFDTHGRMPKDDHDVHHKNRNKKDNRPENLEEKHCSEHGAISRADQIADRKERRSEYGKRSGYRMEKGSHLAKERGAKGGRRASRNKKRAGRQVVKSSRRRAA